MRRLAFVLGLLLTGVAVAPSALEAQITRRPAPELWLMARADSVLVQVPLPPDPNHGFVVYRGPAGGELERITPRPVTPARSPAQAAALLDDDLSRAMDRIRAENEVQFFRRVQADAFTASSMSMLFRGVARALGRFYADPDVEPGATYDYRLVFVDENGEETDETRSGTVTVEDVVPDTVRNLQAEGGDLRVTLDWDYPEYQGAPLDFVVGFHVYRARGDEPFQRISEPLVVRNDRAPLRFVDEDVRNGVEYRYTVRAVDMAGREGPPLDPVTATPFDPSPPAPPEQVATDPGDGVVRLAWRMSPEPDLTGYFVERSTGLSAPYSPLNEEPVAAEEPFWTDSTVVGGTRYFYRVVAVDDRGRRSRPSTAAVAVPFDVTPPEPPGEPSVAVENRNLRVSWAPSPSGDASGYHVYRGEAEDRLVRVNQETVPDTTFLDTGFEEDGLEPGQRYVIRITAVDRSANESPPTTASVVIPDDEPPTGPTALQARNIRGRHAEVRWNASSSRDVAAYLLLRADSGAASAALLDSLDAGESPHAVRDTGVVRGESYRYEVVSVDSAGNRSPPATATLRFRDFDPPPPPRFAEAAVTEEGGVRVTWERVVAPDLAGYRVFRSTSPTGVYEAVSGLVGPDEPRTFVDPDGTDRHHYTVRAVDTSGNESEASPAVSPPGGS